MKNTTLVITFDCEKLDVLNYHMIKKEIDLKGEMVETIQKLYEKHVPQNTREYLEDRLEREEKNKKPRLVSKGVGEKL